MLEHCISLVVYKVAVHTVPVWIPVSQRRIQNSLVHYTYNVQSSGDEHVLEVNFIMGAGHTALITDEEIRLQLL